MDETDATVTTAAPHHVRITVPRSRTTAAGLIVPSDDGVDYGFQDDDQAPQESGTSPLVWFLFLVGIAALL